MRALIALIEKYRFNPANGTPRIALSGMIPIRITGCAMTKTFSFAVMHFTIAFGVVYALTGSLLVGGAVALIEPALNTIAFYFHEKVWNRWERRRAKPVDLSLPVFRA